MKDLNFQRPIYCFFSSLGFLRHRGSSSRFNKAEEVGKFHNVFGEEKGDVSNMISQDFNML
jgi:hypothetical protein